MADRRREEQTVPLPADENEEERRRVRQSNDRDQQKEHRGEQSRHNLGYDEAVTRPRRESRSR